ncbi:MAG: DEAD/DEAH box helicase [Nitrospinota bacterium]|nr:DEAD/DEAH box helicase [Nitrospinota bacterium]
MTFDDLGLIGPIARAVREEGYTIPTPIQAGAIPVLLEGRDLLGLAQTGTGKTAAFMLPTLQSLSSGRRAKPGAPRALILTPTRELCVQVGQSAATYGKYLNLSSTVIYGGVGQGPQAQALRRGVDIVVATPGRLMDLMSQRLLTLTNVEIFILDEADRMLDMGFINDVRRIAETIPENRQTLLFSATMPPEVKKLAHDLLIEPATVAVNPTSSAAPNIDQKVMFVSRENKDALLNELLRDESVYRALVFTRTKRRADSLAKSLNQNSHAAESIHGGKAQNARQRALANFVKGRTRVLVATDLAARGVDIDGITHVINFDMPIEPESYVHRIGRTARAGASGIAISFCDNEERGCLRSIERIIKQRVAVEDSHPFHVAVRETKAPSSFGEPRKFFQRRRRPERRAG